MIENEIVYQFHYFQKKCLEIDAAFASSEQDKFEKIWKWSSTKATKEAAIIAKASPALKVGVPHWKGEGFRFLHVTS